MGSDVYMTILIFCVIFIPVLLLLTFMPFAMRKTESFGVSIPSKAFHDPFIKGLRKTYATVMAIAGVIILLTIICFTFLSPELGNEVIMPVGVIGTIIVSFLIYLRFHYKMKDWKAAQAWEQQARHQRVVIDTRFRKQTLTYSNHWFWIAFSIWLVTVLITMLTYNQIPARIPINFDLSGNVNRWVDKTVWSVGALLILQLVLIGLFVLVNWIIHIAKQQVDPADPEGSIQRNILFRRKWSAFMIVIGIGNTLLLSIIQFSIIYAIDPMWIGFISILFSLLIVGFSIILTVRIGQGGSLIKLEQEQWSDQANISDDRYWKFGQFYFNPNDSALFVEKRFGIGWTINMAKPLAWIILLGPILAIILITFLVN